MEIKEGLGGSFSVDEELVENYNLLKYKTKYDIFFLDTINVLYYIVCQPSERGSF